MGKCYEHLDNGRPCPRNARQLNGRCGKCHGITALWKHCTQPAVKGKYCGRDHKTLDEIAEHRASKLSQSRSRSRNRRRRSAATNSNWASYGTRQGLSNPEQRSYGPTRGAQRTSSASYKGPSKKTKTEPRPRRPLTRAAKREAARLCADAILGQGILKDFDSQITDLVSEQLMQELTRNWDGKQCDELAKIARGLLGVRGYLIKVLRIIADWILLNRPPYDSCGP